MHRWMSAAKHQAPAVLNLGQRSLAVAADVAHHASTRSAVEFASSHVLEASAALLAAEVGRRSPELDSGHTVGNDGPATITSGAWVRPVGSNHVAAPAATEMTESLRQFGQSCAAESSVCAMPVVERVTIGALLEARWIILSRCPVARPPPSAAAHRCASLRIAAF